LREGGVAIGMSLMELGTRGVPKVLEYAGLDYVTIDMEHSAFGIDRVADIIAWMKSTTVAPFVRVPENQYHFLAGVLDAGAMGVQVSNLQNANEVREVVEAIKY